MGFGDHYINVFTVLRTLGFLSHLPVKLTTGQDVVPLKVVKALLPDPKTLAPGYTGKTCIGNFVKGWKDGNLDHRASATLPEFHLSPPQCS